MRSLSLRVALGLALFIGLVVPAMVCGVLLLERQREILRAELETDQVRLVEILNVGLREPMWTLSPELGEPLMASAMADRRVLRILATADAEVFLERHADHQPSGEVLTVTHEITRSGEVIGTVSIDMDSGPMEFQLRRQRQGYLLFAGIQVIISLLVLAYVLRRRVMLPLDRLSRHARRLAAKELDEPFEWSSGDEIGQLGQVLEETRSALAELFEALEIRNDELAELNRDLGVALTARSQFLANMSHELRTPLNSVVGFSEILKGRLEGRLKEREIRFLDNIHASGQRLERLVENVLDLSLIEVGRVDLAPEPVQVSEVINTVIEMLHERMEMRRVRVEVDLADDLPALHADPGRLKQIVYNLTANALKFSPEGGTVELRATRIEEPTTGIHLEVQDHGIGIEPELQSEIFQPFAQVEGGMNRNFEGAGLGLTLVQRLVELHGGRVDLVSELGRGSTFIVELPITTGRMVDSR